MIKKNKKSSASNSTVNEETKNAAQADDFEEVSWETLAHLTNGGSRTNRDKKYDAAN